MVSGVEQGGPASHLGASSMAPLRNCKSDYCLTKLQLLKATLALLRDRRALEMATDFQILPLRGVQTVIWDMWQV